MDESERRNAICKLTSAIAIAKELLYETSLSIDDTTETEVESSSHSGTYEIKAYSFLYGQKPVPKRLSLPSGSSPAANGVQTGVDEA